MIEARQPIALRQGDLIWVRFPTRRGSEPAGRRPALVIQDDAFNRSRINTVIVAAITSNLRLEQMPANVRLSKGEGGIPKPSVVNLSQIHSIDRAFVDSKIGTISAETLEWVKAGVRVVLGV